MTVHLRFMAMNLRSVKTFVGFCLVVQLLKCQHCSAQADIRQTHRNRLGWGRKEAVCAGEGDGGL